MHTIEAFISPSVAPQEDQLGLSLLTLEQVAAREQKRAAEYL